MTVQVAHIEYSDKAEREELRGFRNMEMLSGAVLFVWSDEQVMIPMRRINLIVRSEEEE